MFSPFRITNPDTVKVIQRKLCAPLVTLLSAEPEIQYVALRNIDLIVQKRPSILASEVKVSLQSLMHACMHALLHSSFSVYLSFFVSVTSHACMHRGGAWIRRGGEEGALPGDEDLPAGMKLESTHKDLYLSSIDLQSICLSIILLFSILSVHLSIYLTICAVPVSWDVVFFFELFSFLCRCSFVSTTTLCTWRLRSLRFSFA